MDKVLLWLRDFILVILAWIDEQLGSDPVEPPPGPELWDRKSHMDTWPGRFHGVRVGYVKLKEAKSPLYTLILNSQTGAYNIPAIYENHELRGGQTTDALRIIAKAPNWFMVKIGDVWGHGDPRPFGEKIDGNTLWYEVHHGQIIDGITLTDIPDPLYIRFDHVSDLFYPGA